MLIYVRLCMFKCGSSLSRERAIRERSQSTQSIEIRVLQLEPKILCLVSNEAYSDLSGKYKFNQTRGQQGQALSMVLGHHLKRISIRISRTLSQDLPDNLKLKVVDNLLLDHVGLPHFLALCCLKVLGGWVSGGVVGGPCYFSVSPSPLGTDWATQKLCFQSGTIEYNLEM